MVRQQRQANFDLIYSPWPCLFYVYSRKDIRYILQKAKVEREGDRIIYDSYIVHSYPYDTTPMMDQTPPFCLVRPSLRFALLAGLHVHLHLVHSQIMQSDRLLKKQREYYYVIHPAEKTANK